METWVGLLDCNNFFVSCERLFRPDLIGKPVVVLSSNDGCVVARSQEVKDMDIPMGVPYFKIKDILQTKQVTVFSGNHRLYRDVSKRVFAVMRELLDDIEQYSVDEAFFCIEGDSLAKIELVIQTIKDKVEQQIGIPVSLGVGRSKTLAKVANDIAKRSNGRCVLTDAVWSQRQSSLSLSSIWGIGGRLAKRFAEHEIRTVADLLVADPARIKQLFGVVGLRLREELSGQPVLRTKEVPKQSIMSSRSFAATTTACAVLEEAVAFHVEQVTWELRQIGQRAGKITVFIAPSRHGDFVLHNQTGERVLTEPANDTAVILQTATELVRELYRSDIPYKKAGVRVSELVPEQITQLGLFREVTIENNALQQTLDGLNSRFVTGRVHFGFLEGKRAYSARTNLRSPSYTTKWSDVAEVKA